MERINNSIFKRLVITFLVIMLPIYALGIYIYQWGLHTVEAEIQSSAVAQVSFYLEGLEKEIERMKILQYDCLNDEYLNKLAIRWEVMDNYGIVESMRQLQLRLITIQNSSAYIKSVSAHIRPLGKTISSRSGVDALDEDKFLNIRVPSGVRGAQIVEYDGGHYLTTLQQDNFSSRNPIYMIEIELNQAAFRQALLQFNTYEGSGCMLLNLNSQSLFASQPVASEAPNESELLAIAQSDAGMQPVTFAERAYYIPHAKSDYLGMAMLRYIPSAQIRSPLQNFYVWVWVFSLTALVIILVFALSSYRFMHRPMAALVDSFRKVEQGDLNVSIDHGASNEFGYLYQRFNDMVRNLRASIDQVYKQKLLTQRAELKQLQSQINPHFLYNSLFMINTMAKVGDENLGPFTRLLGEYFRFITRNASDFVPLEEEVGHARAYAEIQQMRFPRRLKVEFEDCPEAFLALMVPRLILQPVIENAFEHGVEKKTSGGLVSVRFAHQKGELDIVVRDNGGELTAAALESLQRALADDTDGLEITGLININRRLKLLYGAQGGLSVERNAQGGLTATIRIGLEGGVADVPNADR